MRENTHEMLVGTGVKQSTAEKYCYDLALAEKILDVDVDTMTQSDYNRLLNTLDKRTVAERFWLDKEVEQTHSSSSKRGFIYALKAYWRATDDEERLKYIKRVPKNVAVRKTPSISDSVIKQFMLDVWELKFTHEERKEHQVVNPFLEYRNKFMVIFAYFFATRRSEIPLVKLSDIDYEKKQVVIEDTKGGGGKFDEPATSELFWALLNDYSMHRKGIPGDFLFPKTNGKQIEPGTVYLATRMCDKILKKYRVRGVNLTPHLMRRSMATRAAGSLSLKDAMHITRHKSVQAFQRYIDMSDKKGTIDRIEKSGALDVK